MSDTTATAPVVDFAAIKAGLGEDYDNPFQVLDENHRVVNQEVFDTFTDDELVHFMEIMLRERILHEQTTVFSKQGRLGFYAPTLGQEASQLGSVTAFQPQDYLFPSYRDLPQMIEHGAITPAQGYLWSRGHVQGNRMADGHRSWFPQIIIGAQHIAAAGAALGLKKNGEDAVAFSYSGDGSTSQGDTYEGLNFAGAFQSPLVMIIQNNGWAISVPRDYQTHTRTLAQKAVAAGVPSVQVDGMDRRPLVDELAGDLAADSGPTSGDDDAFSLEFHGAECGRVLAGTGALVLPAGAAGVGGGGFLPGVAGPTVAEETTFSLPLSERPGPRCLPRQILHGASSRRWAVRTTSPTSPTVRPD